MQILNNYKNAKKKDRARVEVTADLELGIQEGCLI